MKKETVDNLKGKFSGLTETLAYFNIPEKISLVLAFGALLTVGMAGVKAMKNYEKNVKQTQRILASQEQISFVVEKVFSDYKTTATLWLDYTGKTSKSTFKGEVDGISDVTINIVVTDANKSVLEKFHEGSEVVVLANVLPNFQVNFLDLTKRDRSIGFDNIVSVDGYVLTDEERAISNKRRNRFSSEIIPSIISNTK